jgi:hypothetical protein
MSTIQSSEGETSRTGNNITGAYATSTDNESESSGGGAGQDTRGSFTETPR